MKIRLKRRPHFSLEKLLLFVAIFCVSTFALLEYASISIPLFSLVKWPLLYVGGACLISQLNLLMKMATLLKNTVVMAMFINQELLMMSGQG